MTALSPLRCTLLLSLLVSFVHVATAASTGDGGAQARWSDFKPQRRIPADCTDYTTYAQTPHAPYSSGPLRLPSMRPPQKCRTFRSDAAEFVIKSLTQRMRDPDLARLFENAFPSTLDTTVRYLDADDAGLAFIVTGDIDAQWLRDATGQLVHMRRLLAHDADLRGLVRAVIATEARYVAQFPYCGAFQPPPESGLPPSHNAWADGVRVSPAVDNNTVFECKYELDSLAAFLKLSRVYHEHTRGVVEKKGGPASLVIDDSWRVAMRAVLRVLREQSQSSWDESGGDGSWRFVSYYNWTGTAGKSLAPEVPNGGNGEPRLADGLVASSHRPSDDIVVFPYVTPVNAMMAVELGHVANMLNDAGDGGRDRELAQEAKYFSRAIEDAVWRNTRTGGGGRDDGVFSYETNGYGGMYLMDDANVPSLLSLPYLGFLSRDDDTYRRTKAAMMSRKNPYYAEGKTFRGAGGPHVGATYPWPMSQISAIFGSNDDKEIRERLDLVLGSTSGLGLIHESVSIYNGSDYTRPWFAWANSYFAEMVLDLAERKPWLILDTSEPYLIEKELGGGKRKGKSH